MFAPQLFGHVIPPTSGFYSKGGTEMAGLLTFPGTRGCEAITVTAHTVTEVEQVILKEKLCNKFQELLDSASILSKGNAYGQVFNDQHAHDCAAWLVSAQNLTHVVLGSSPSNPYRTRIDVICSTSRDLVLHSTVGKAASILATLQSDIDQGLISSVENQTRAIVFDDFLDHAKEYAKQNLSNESGVIAGVVFEDALRSICRSNGIREKRRKLDQLISELSRVGVLTQVQAKRGRAAADVRTKATHAQWQEFGLPEVIAAITFTEELIEKYLAADQ